MSQKSIKVKLSKETLTDLKESGYSMCFAKKVNGVYNVIWKATKEYLQNTTFSWEPKYKVFATNTYEANVKVTTDTEPVTVMLGQQCTLNVHGILEDAVTRIPSNNKECVTIINKYGNIHSGISQVCKINDEEEITPIYVSKEARVIGEIELEPKECVMVWFEANVETSTIFETAKTNAQLLDLTDKDTWTIGYDSKTGNWSIL